MLRAAGLRTAPMPAGRAAVASFTVLATRAATAMGSAWAFALALAGVLAWLLTGPYFGYSQTWQLVINTATTIVTFLVVFLIQHTQNRDALAIQLKLNELVAAIRGASNELIDVERLSDDELRALHERYATLLRKLEAARDAATSHSVDEVGLRPPRAR